MGEGDATTPTRTNRAVVARREDEAFDIKAETTFPFLTVRHTFVGLVSGCLCPYLFKHLRSKEFCDEFNLYVAVRL